MSKIRNTARQDRKTNKRQRGENHNRDQRLDGHDAALSSHQGQIDSEKSTRQSADSNLHGRVDNEATARSNKDSNLDNQTQALRDRASALESFQGRPAGFAGNPHGDNQHTENYAKAANVYAQSTTDNRFLKADKHPDFTTGHGDDHHSVRYARAGHTHSISVKDMPQAERQKLLTVRNTIENMYKSKSSTYSDTAIANRINACIDNLRALNHAMLDTPEMAFPELHQRLTVDDGMYRFEEQKRSSEDQDEGSFYYRKEDGTDTDVPPNQIFSISSRTVKAENVQSLTMPRPPGSASGDILIAAFLHPDNVAIKSPSMEGGNYYTQWSGAGGTFTYKGWKITVFFRSAEGGTRHQNFTFDLRVPGSGGGPTTTPATAEKIIGGLFIYSKAEFPDFSNQNDPRWPIASTGYKTAENAVALTTNNQNVESGAMVLEFVGLVDEGPVALGKPQQSRGRMREFLQDGDSTITFYMTEQMMAEGQTNGTPFSFDTEVEAVLSATAVIAPVAGVQYFPPR